MQLKVFKCRVCGKSLQDKPSRNRQYCSRNCWIKRSPQVATVCSYCRKKFKRYNFNKIRQFCSRKCANKAMERRKTVVCQSCEKEFEISLSKTIGRGKYCSKKCAGKAQRERQKGKNNALWNGGTSQKPYLFGWNIIRKKIRKRDNYICQLCGKKQEKTKKAFPVHHVDYNKENNLFNNLITLCYSCHGKTMRDRKQWIKCFKEIMI